MATNWPNSISLEIIQNNYSQCKACLEAQSSKTPFSYSYNLDKVTFKKSIRTKKSGEQGQLDLWGPYTKGRQAFIHIFILVDAYTQFAVSYH